LEREEAEAEEGLATMAQVAEVLVGINILKIIMCQQEHLLQRLAQVAQVVFFEIRVFLETLQAF
jgi:hypothetical protein